MCEDEVLDALRRYHGRDDVNMEMRRILEWKKVFCPDVHVDVYVKWTEDEWRARCPVVGNKWTQWVKERMPKKIQPMEKTLKKCQKCGKNAVDMYLKQTRGGDEPMTEFCYCTACKYRWRQ